MKTTTSNSMRVKARRDAWDLGGAGREDSSSIGFDTPATSTISGSAGTGPQAGREHSTAGLWHTGLERRS